MRRTMHLRHLVLVPALALGLAPAAGAAELATDRSCYLESSTAKVAMSGTGFTPGATYQVVLDGQPLPGGTGTVGADGSVSGSFAPPSLAGSDEATHSLTVQEGSNVASAAFTVTTFRADFAPGRGNPSSLRVRFSVFGFGLAGRDKSVYVHYIRPNGKRKKTVRLGRATGPCGKIERTARRRLFPFKAERGNWKLQFDTSRRFRRGRSNSDFLFYTLGVRISRLG